MNEINPTLKGVLIKESEQILRLYEEVNELALAVINKDKENIGEELMDVIQWCMNISKKHKINLEYEVYKHNKKLISRGHLFCKEGD